ncbi:hypothetical protein PAPYR_13324 [Paratrimastix pyriformis]|uniref:Uncharacterized protein n=1 Tax=Paratrimastix pyriformis TaxID=342808 RepID=A0ABQ8U1X5_9EUKA|nr:hypothetical protein PAPYR_13324 [Paratrimastix pyriformis]
MKARRVVRGLHLRISRQPSCEIPISVDQSRPLRARISFFTFAEPPCCSITERTKRCLVQNLSFKLIEYRSPAVSFSQPLLESLSADLLAHLATFTSDPTVTYLQLIATSHACARPCDQRGRTVPHRRCPLCHRGPCAHLVELELAPSGHCCSAAMAAPGSKPPSKPHLQSLAIPRLGGLTEAALGRILALVGPQLLRAITLDSAYHPRRVGVTQGMVAALVKHCPGLETLRAYCAPSWVLGSGCWNCPG